MFIDRCVHHSPVTANFLLFSTVFDHKINIASKVADVTLKAFFILNFSEASCYRDYHDRIQIICRDSHVILIMF